MKAQRRIALLAAPFLVLMLAAFSDGTYRVGGGPGQVPSATYTAPGGPKCSWARLDAKGKVLAKGGGKAVQRVGIPKTDASFKTTGCGDWKVVPEPKPTTPTTAKPAPKPTTTTTQPRPVTTTTTMPAGPRTVFEDGTWPVGGATGVVPGLYRSNTGGSCYWARLRNFTGNGIIANYIGDGPVLVQVMPADAGIEVSRCSFRPYSPPAAPASTITTGLWKVGADIQPGTYSTPGSSDSCYWARLRNFEGTGDIIQNYIRSGPAVVTIDASDVGFRSSRCGTFTKIG